MLNWDRREPVKTPEGMFHATSFCVELPGVVCADFGPTPERAVERRRHREEHIEWMANNGKKVMALW